MLIGFIVVVAIIAVIGASRISYVRGLDQGWYDHADHVERLALAEKQAKEAKVKASKKTAKKAAKKTTSKSTGSKSTSSKKKSKR